MAKSSPRPEWNCLPGYVAAGKLRGEPREQFAALGLKIDPDTLAEFLKTPVGAIETIMFKRGNEAPKGQEFDPNVSRLQDGENARHLLELFYRVGCVLVMAERERVKEDEDQPAGE